MYIIDESYFQSDLFIPNSNELNSSALDVLGQFIDSKARLCLKNALGYTLFSELDSYIVSGNLDPLAPQKWLNLVNGVEYTKGDTTYKWDGLIYTEGTKNQSLLAYYVYYYWLLNEQQKQTGVGTVSLQSKNATNVNATQTLVNVWNNFVTLYQFDCEDVYEYYYNTDRFFPFWVSSDSSNYVSLLKFLNDNEDDYPEASMRGVEYKNSFGL